MEVFPLACGPHCLSASQPTSTRGARVGVLTGPPGAAKTDALVTCAAMLAAFTDAKILLTAHANDSVAVIEAGDARSRVLD